MVQRFLAEIKKVKGKNRVAKFGIQGHKQGITEENGHKHYKNRLLKLKREAN